MMNDIWLRQLRKMAAEGEVPTTPEGAPGAADQPAPAEAQDIPFADRINNWIMNLKPIKDMKDRKMQAAITKYLPMVAMGLAGGGLGATVAGKDNRAMGGLSGAALGAIIAYMVMSSQGEPPLGHRPGAGIVAAAKKVGSTVGAHPVAYPAGAIFGNKLFQRWRFGNMVSKGLLRGADPVKSGSALARRTAALDIASNPARARAVLGNQPARRALLNKLQGPTGTGNWLTSMYRQLRHGGASRQLVLAVDDAIEGAAGKVPSIVSRIGRAMT